MYCDDSITIIWRLNIFITINALTFKDFVLRLERMTLFRNF